MKKGLREFTQADEELTSLMKLMHAGVPTLEELTRIIQQADKRESLAVSNKVFDSSMQKRHGRPVTVTFSAGKRNGDAIDCAHVEHEANNRAGSSLPCFVGAVPGATG